MILYYIKYNGIDLTQLVKVRDVSIPSLPEIEHNSIDMWEMDGNLFSSLSYGDRVIELTAIIQPLNPNDLETYINDVKRAFFVRSPQPLYVGDETKYILAVPEGDLTIAELGKGTCELSVTLIAYTPFWIGKEVKNANIDGKEGIVENSGDVPTYPVISIGIEGDTTFVQLEKKDTKERILLGELPRTGRETVKANSYVLLDECQTASGWVQSSAALDSGCGTGGTLTVTNDGGGLCAASFGNSSTTWKGACYRKNLDTGVRNFKVGVSFEFNSTGKNGDPTVTEKIKDNMNTSVGGTVTYEYKVRTTTGLCVRSGPGNGYKKLGLYTNGHTISSGVVTNGWLKHVYNDKVAYVNMKYLTKVAIDNRYTTGACNFVVNKTTVVRSAATPYATAKTTIPTGTVVRCSIETYQKYQQDGGTFRRLMSPYNGKTGYVDASALTQASEATISYEVEGEVADDKQGICQLYGFSSSGVQLFSLSMIDDSEWYEAARPVIKKNGVLFLTDDSFDLPDPKKEAVFSNSTITYENVSSGRYGGWNEFIGNLYIERIDNVWYAWGGRSGEIAIRSEKVHDTYNGEEELAYVVVYIGTSDTERAAGMAINEVRVQTATAVEPSVQNIQRFEAGDVIEIDCGVPSVKLNDEERNDLVDIGSQFFDLAVGENEIKAASDSDFNLSFLFNEKYL